MAVVLKLRVGEEVRRVYLKEVASVDEMTFAVVKAAVAEAWPECSGRTAKYADEEGDMCTLTESTFVDFRELSVAAAAASGKQPAVLRLELGEDAFSSAAADADKKTTKEPEDTEKGDSAEELPDPSALLGGIAAAFQDLLGNQASHSDGVSGNDMAEQFQSLKGMFKGFFKGKGKGKGKGKEHHHHHRHHDSADEAEIPSWLRAKQAFLVLSQLNAEGLLSEATLVAAAIASLPHMLQMVSQNPEKADGKLKELASKHPDLVQEIISLLSQTAGMEEVANSLLAFVVAEEGVQQEGSLALQLLTAVHALSFDSQVDFLMLLAATVSEPLKKALDEKEKDGRFNWMLSMHRQHHSMQHTAVACDGCGVTPITGLRFKDTEAPDFDLCSECFLKKGGSDWANHEFKCIPWSSGFEHWKGMCWPGAKGKGKCWKGDGGSKGKGKCKGSERATSSTAASPDFTTE
eukprot:CAMPEP_0178399350 /NCGR_PEP_ID=MMETSP0689_2-20121128/15236_1 /TAXON_ID=160604 /ORGANISM="Amphidinium massartii, Strain CS-259" /LENGTH=461 /DNA_ID=CAMNT_0020020127 /DNA_START=124 /DNA_END=1509 /DNA_ORIENTATION=-